MKINKNLVVSICIFIIIIILFIVLEEFKIYDIAYLISLIFVYLKLKEVF